MVAPLIPAGAIIRVEALADFSGVYCMHRWYFSLKQPQVFLTGACYRVLGGIIVGLLCPWQTNHVRWVYVRAKTVGEPVIWEDTIFPEEPIYGFITGGALSSVSAPCWQFRTERIGRRGRGRMFFFGMLSTITTDGVKITDNEFLNFRTIANGWMNNYSLNGTDEVLMSGVFSERGFSISGDASAEFAPLFYINCKQRLSACSKRID